MVERAVFVVLSDIFAVIWWTLYVRSRREAEKARLAEEAKYVVWDAAYKQAVKAGKTEYYALMDAVKAVRGGPAIFKVWEEAYNKAISKGVRKYKAGLMATAAARKAAHG